MIALMICTGKLAANNQALSGQATGNHNNKGTQVTAETPTDKAAKDSDQAPQPASSKMGEFLALLKDAFVVLVFYVVFSTFGWASFHIPSGSMEPTLEVGDRIFVSKLSYGYNRHSFFFDPSVISQERLFEDMPQRGEVAVFTMPRRGHEDVIKRVIGLPGDRIQMRRGRLYINDELIERTLVQELTYTSYTGTQRIVKEYDETLPNGVVHRIYESTDSGLYDNVGPFVVPPGHYFMMGDNRDGSSDSRNLNDIGYVPLAHFVGRADITTFSLYDCDQGKDVYCPIGVPLGRFFNSLN